MTQISLDSAAGGTLAGGLTRSVRIDVYPGAPEEGLLLPTPVQKRIIEAFSAGRSLGVLHLGAAELSTELHPTLSHWRDIGQSFVAKVCGALGPTDPSSLVVVVLDPDPDEISAFVQAAPPMRRAELIKEETLEDLWSDIRKALSAETKRFGDAEWMFGTPSSPAPDLAEAPWM